MPRSEATGGPINGNASPGFKEVRRGFEKNFVRLLGRVEGGVRRPPRGRLETIDGSRQRAVPEAT